MDKKLKTYLASCFKKNDICRKSGLASLSTEWLTSLPDIAINAIQQYSDYEAQLNRIYTRSDWSDLYNFGQSMVDSPMAMITEVEEKTSGQPDVKRLIYDGLLDMSISKIIFPKNESISRPHSFTRFSSNENAKICSTKTSDYVDILFNTLGFFQGVPSVTESHFQLLYSLCRTIQNVGLKSRIYILGLPFSGFGWPKGDSTLCHGAEHGLIISNLFNDVYDQIILQPEIHFLEFDEKLSWAQIIKNAYWSFASRPSHNVVAEIDFCCVSGSFLTAIPRLTKAKRIMLSACSNNRFFVAPFDIHSIICNNPDNTISRHKVVDKCIPYYPIASSRSSSKLTPLISNVQSDSRTTCIICSNYLDLVAAQMLKDHEIYKPLCNTNSIIIGRASSEARLIFNKIFYSSQFTDFCTDLPEIFRKASKQILHPFTLAPYGMYGMATSIILSAHHKIPILADKACDANAYLSGDHMEANRLDYSIKLKLLSDVMGYKTVSTSIKSKLHQAINKKAQKQRKNFLDLITYS